MKRRVLPRYFFASVLLLLILASAYVFFEGRRFRRELILQAEGKAEALAQAMETSAKNAVLGNSLLEHLAGQRLLDNARLIDQILLSRPLDQAQLREVSALNHLQKVELLDQQGRPWKFQESPMQKRMREMMGKGPGAQSEKGREERRAMMTYMWGMHWPFPGQTQNVPPRLSSKFGEKKFWEGSLFGAAIGARSFPGIIAVHANADDILKFKKEIGIQKQIEELGRQSDIEYVALLDSDFKVVADTDPARIDQRDGDPLLAEVKTDGRGISRIVQAGGGKPVYEVIKPIHLDPSTLSYLKIGLALEPAEAAWRKSLASLIVLGAAVLAVGVLGMAAIFYNQHAHMREVSKLEAEIARQERLSALGNLAATVAHEIRNPLNAISMGLQRLKAEFHPTPDEGEYSRFVELMRGEVQRLNSIVEQFLSLARPLDLKPEEVRLDELLKELMLLTEGDARSAKVRTRVIASPDLLPVKADRNHLKQLLLNLVLNGLQAMPDGGALTLEAKASHGNLILTVSDTGTGIAPELLPRIFEPYFTTKPRGSGLGLAIARRIAEAHGGEIVAESAPGQGSRFRISIPLTAPEN